MPITTQHNPLPLVGAVDITMCAEVVADERGRLCLSIEVMVQ